MPIREIDTKDRVKPLSNSLEDPEDNGFLKPIRKAVDITDYCPKVDRNKRLCVISYYPMKKGVLVDVFITWEMRNYDGMSCCPFYMGQIDEYLNGAGLREVIGHMGIDKGVLKKLIEENIP